MDDTERFWAQARLDTARADRGVIAAAVRQAREELDARHGGIYRASPEGPTVGGPS